MKVYIMVAGTDYEGCENVGVYATSQTAVEACEARVAASREEDEYSRFKRTSANEWRDGDSYLMIEAHEVL